MKKSCDLNKIKVCHIIVKMVYGGASLGTLQLIERLEQSRFKSTILCGSQSEQEGDLLQSIEKGIFIIIPEMVREINPVKDFITFLKLIAIIKKYKYNVVHTHGSKAGVIGRLAAAICRVPVILYTVHGWGLKAGNFITRTLFRLVEKAVASFSTMLLFQTKSDMDEAFQHKIGSEKQYYLIGNGINIQPFLKFNGQKAKNIRAEFALHRKRIIGTVGRVSAQKNPHGFIEIARKVLKKRQDVKFIFVGGGELLDDMQSQVRNLGLSQSIIFTGVRCDVPELIANFNVFVLPSLWEGMPRSVIEAMVMSKPIVVHNISGIDEIIEDGKDGFIIPINKTHTFSERILYLLDNPDIARTIGKYGFMKAKKFDYNLVVEKVRNIYVKLYQDNC